MGEPARMVSFCKVGVAGGQILMLSPSCFGPPHGPLRLRFCGMGFILLFHEVSMETETEQVKFLALRTSSLCT